MAEVAAQATSSNTRGSSGIRRTMTASAIFTTQGVVASGLAGGLIGAGMAQWKGHSRLSWGFSMGSNWLFISLPFFAIREGLLHYRHYSNSKKGRDNVYQRDRDELFASAGAGTCVGAGLGYIYRGGLMTASGAILYGFLFGVGQMSLSALRHWRQRQGVKLREMDQYDLAQSPIPLEPYALDRQRNADPKSMGWYHHPINDNANTVFRENVDPVREAISWVWNKLFTEVDVPSWASPMMNAVDLDYRQRLNAKLLRLESDVELLREKLDELGLLEKAYPAMKKK